jgi:hypothetical protein
MAVNQSKESQIQLIAAQTDDNRQAPSIMDIDSAKPDPPPNGGSAAWIQVFMGHLVLINGWGYLTSFGLFQSYYTSTLAVSQSSISWIGSIQIFLVYLIGTVSGRALDVGHFHTVLNLGCFLQVFAVFMTSISSQYWQVFLAQGICKGIGDGLVFCPTVAHILLNTAVPRHGVYRLWRGNRRHHLSSDRTAATSQRWLWLDSQGDGLCRLVQLSHHCHDRPSTPTTA